VPALQIQLIDVRHRLKSLDRGGKLDHSQSQISQKLQSINY